MPRVSVVIPTRGPPELLGEAVASVLAQTFADLEVIVCEDGSSGATRARAEAFGSPVRYLPGPASGRPGAPRNRGVRAAAGAWVAFLDDDDLWEPEKLALQMGRLEADPHLGVVYTDRRVRGADGSLSPPVLTGAQKRPDDLLALALSGRFPQLSTTLFRRELLERAGGFDETLATAEDLDLWLRLPAGTRAACVAEPLVTVRRRPGSLSDGSGEQAFTNAVRVLERRLEQADLSGRHRRLARRAIARLHLERARWLRARGEDAAARRALGSALRARPAGAGAWALAARLWLGRA